MYTDRTFFDFMCIDNARDGYGLERRALFLQGWTQRLNLMTNIFLEDAPFHNACSDLYISFSDCILSPGSTARDTILEKSNVRCQPLFFNSHLVNVALNKLKTSSSRFM